MKREGIRSKRKRDTTAGNARLVGLVGGHHESVIVKRASECYCVLRKQLQRIDNYCDDCPLKTQA